MKKQLTALIVAVLLFNNFLYPAAAKTAAPKTYKTYTKTIRAAEKIFNRAITRLKKNNFASASELCQQAVTTLKALRLKKTDDDTTALINWIEEYKYYEKRIAALQTAYQKIALPDTGTEAEQISSELAKLKKQDKSHVSYKNEIIEAKTKQLIDLAETKLSKINTSELELSSSSASESSEADSSDTSASGTTATIKQLQKKLAELKKRLEGLSTGLTKIA